MEKIRRRLENRHQELCRAGRPTESNFDINRPWDSVFLEAASDHQYWSEAVKDKVLLFVTSLRGRAELTDEGHHANIAGGVVPPGPGKKKDKDPRPRPRGGPKDRGDDPWWWSPGPGKGKKGDRKGKKGDPKGKKGNKGGKGDKGGRAHQDCWRWTHDEGGCTDPCPNGRAHPLCPRCGKQHWWRQACPS